MSPYESRNSRTFVAASPFLSVLLRATEMQNGFVEFLEPHPLLVAAWKLSEMGLGHTEIKTGAARHEVQGTTKSLHEEMELCVKLRDNQTQGKTGHISRWQLLWFEYCHSRKCHNKQSGNLWLSDQEPLKSDIINLAASLLLLFSKNQLGVSRHTMA